jgi:hypothetical protein
MAVSSVTRSAPQALTQEPEKQKTQKSQQGRAENNGNVEPGTRRDATRSARSAQATESLAKVAEKQRMQEQEKTTKAAEQAAKREAPKPVINSQGQQLGQVINATA